jgi:hypothetical protein
MDEKMKEKKNKQPVRWEVMVILLISLLIAFITFSGVWHLSSIDSMRGYTWAVYSHTDDWEGINEQYDDMVSSFNLGATSFTYEVAGLSIYITKDMVPDQQKDTYIDTVLNKYTDGLYTYNNLTGIKGAIHGVAGSDTHNFYGIMTLISAVLALVVILLMYRWWGLKDFLKQTGLASIIAGVIVFVMLFLVYTLLVDTWIATDESIYKEGLPIIAAMIKEWYYYSVAAAVIVGILLLLPSVIAWVNKGKKKEDVAPQIK